MSASTFRAQAREGECREYSCILATSELPPNILELFTANLYEYIEPSSIVEAWLSMSARERVVFSIFAGATGM